MLWLPLPVEKALRRDLFSQTFFVENVWNLVLLSMDLSILEPYNYYFIIIESH
jgi:hypothetical protein